MVVEIVLGVLIAVLGVATIVAAYVGILGMMGAAPLHRCDQCGHLCLTARIRSAGDCGYCRHDRLLHPMWALRHANSTYWAAHRH